MIFGPVVIEPAYLQGAFDAVKNTTAAPAMPVPVDFFASGMRALAVLIFTLGLIFVLTYLAKRFMPFSPVPGGKKLVRILDITYLTPKKAIYIVEVAGQVLVLGSDANSINLLTKIEGDRAAELTAFGAAASGAKFSGILGKIAAEFENKNTETAGGDAIKKSIRDLHSQVEKLKKLKDDI